MEESEEMQVGKVTHYFPKIGVAIIEVTGGSIKIGDEIHIKGSTTDFRQRIISMEVDYEKIEVAEPGQTIGIRVEEIARKKDLVYRKI
ncbi:MAG: hypothetical protein AABX25_00055 [Nanoarchaeota archaeon]